MKNKLLVVDGLIILILLITGCEPKQTLQKMDCATLKQSFDNYTERRYLPIIENSESLCYGLNVGTDFSKLTPKWAVGELIAIRGSKLTFEGLLQDATISIGIKNTEIAQYKLGENYKIDMNNMCREDFMMMDNRAPSPIAPTFVKPEEVDCS